MPIPVVSMKPGQALSLQATVMDSLSNTIPNPTVNWTSTNLSVATVQPNALGSATVVAKIPGTATITATAQGEAGPVSSQVAVEVVSPLAASLSLTFGTPTP